MDGKTNLDINFYSRGEAKSQIVIEHSKLSDKEQVDKMQLFWKNSLERLSESLKS